MRFFIVNIAIVIFCLSCKDKKPQYNNKIPTNERHVSQHGFNDSNGYQHIVLVRIKNATLNHYNKPAAEISDKKIVDQLCNELGRVKKLDSFAETKNNFGLYELKLFNKEAKQAEEVIITYTIYNGVIIRFMSHPDDRYRNDDLERLVDLLMANNNND